MARRGDNAQTSQYFVLPYSVLFSSVRRKGMEAAFFVALRRLCQETVQVGMSLAPEQMENKKQIAAKEMGVINSDSDSLCANQNHFTNQLKCGTSSREKTREEKRLHSDSAGRIFFTKARINFHANKYACIMHVRVFGIPIAPNEIEMH